jgi:hypothetical protein
LALAFIVKVIVVAEVVTVPDVADAFNQLGTPEIEKFTEPVVALNWYWNADGENGPPGSRRRALVAGVTCKEMPVRLDGQPGSEAVLTST